MEQALTRRLPTEKKLAKKTFWAQTFIFLEKAFTLIALFLYSEGIVALVLSGGADEFTSDYDGTLLRILFAALSAGSFGMLALRWKKVLTILQSSWLIIAVITFTAASVLWSGTPDLTLRRVIAIVGTSLFGLYLASRYTFKEQLQMLAWMLGASMVLSLVFIVVPPHLGIATGNHAGAWRGIYAHKNGLGDRMALSSFTFLLLALDAKRYRSVLWMALAVSFALLILSDSLGALLSLIGPLAAFPLYRALRWNYLTLIPFACLIFLIVVFPSIWIWINLDTVLIALGKDPSLTGRTQIWSLTLDSIFRNPWLGYGYQTFWQGLNGGSAYVWRAMGLEGFRAPHAHNGVLELLLDIGIIGVTIFFLGLWQCFLKSLYWIRNSRHSIHYWPLLFITYMLLTNVSESRLLAYNTLACVLYFSMAFTLAQPLARSAQNASVSTHTQPPRRDQRSQSSHP